jgi:hypothetical protein
VIDKPLPLADMLASSDAVVTAKISKLDVGRTVAVLEVTKTLAGKSPAAKFSISLTVDEDELTRQFLARCEIETHMVLFVTEKEVEVEDKDGKKTTKSHLILAYANGTWYQILGQSTLLGIRWNYIHPEPYLRRTFLGETQELADLVAAVVAGKAKAPKYDPSVKPGLGPELKKKE